MAYTSGYAVTRIMTMKAGAESRQPRLRSCFSRSDTAALPDLAPAGTSVAGSLADGVSMAVMARTLLSGLGAGGGSQEPLPAQDVGHVGVGLLRRLGGAHAGRGV